MRNADYKLRTHNFQLNIWLSSISPSSQAPLPSISLRPFSSPPLLCTLLISPSLPSPIHPHLILILLIIFLLPTLLSFILRFFVVPRPFPLQQFGAIERTGGVQFEPGGDAFEVVQVGGVAGEADD